MIRKSTMTLNFANTGKKAELLRVMTEFRRIVNVFIDVIWGMEKVPGKFFRLKTETWLSVQLQQVASKQALEIVKSQKERKIKHKPELRKLTLTLDSRQVNFIHPKNSFDFWVKLTSIGSKIKFLLPAKKHRHFNGLVEDGWKLKKSVRLGIKGDSLVLDVYFEKDAPKIKTEGAQLGIDIGYKKLMATSDAKTYGSGFKDLAEKIQRKKQGSIGFKKALIERDNYIDKTVKELPLDSVKTIVIEHLKGLKNGRRFTKKFQAKFQRWTYPQLIKRLKLTAERQGVLVAEVNPAYTSQTCSKCGCKDKNSRNGELFACTSCGYSLDADINASVNISMKFRLPEHLDPVKFCLQGCMEQVLNEHAINTREKGPESLPRQFRKTRSANG